MKKALKITAAVTAVLLIAGILWVYNSFCGNIFSAMYAKSQIEKYIDEAYPNNDYEVGDAGYNFKFGEYHCKITDPDIQDGSFNATYGSNGSITDDYEEAVKNLGNTIYRLDDGLRKSLEPLIASYFDEDEQEFGFATVIGDKEVDRSRLYLDMKFDVKNMPMETYIYGSLNGNSQKGLDRMKKMAEDLKVMGYRIDYYSFSNDIDYFDNVPVDELLNASNVDALQKYRLPDDTKNK